MRTMHRMKLFTALFALIAGVLVPSLPAQESAAKILLELDEVVPVKSPINGLRQPVTPRVDWNEVADQLGELASRANGTSAEPTCLYYAANALFQAERIDEARVMLLDLKKRFPEHPLVKVKIDDDGNTLVGNALEDCEKELAFRSQHDVKMLPIPKLDTSLTATLNFSVGDVEIAFYENAAPKHRENFLKLAREGFYDRICVHRINPDQDIYLGCPNTRQHGFQEWGRGGPGYALPNEFSRVCHEKGTVTSIPAPRAGMSHGSQFMILLESQPAYDFVQTPFARVIRGLEVVHKISTMQRNQNSAPLERVYLNGITINDKRAKKE